MPQPEPMMALITLGGSDGSGSALTARVVLASVAATEKATEMRTTEEAMTAKVAMNRAVMDKAAAEKVATDKAVVGKVTAKKVVADKATAMKVAEEAVVKATMDVALAKMLVRVPGPGAHRPWQRAVTRF
jgi:lysozyme family protein